LSAELTGQIVQRPARFADGDVGGFDFAVQILAPGDGGEQRGRQGREFFGLAAGDFSQLEQFGGAVGGARCSPAFARSSSIKPDSSSRAADSVVVVMASRSTLN
jgi:hypothetical protein